MVEFLRISLLSPQLVIAVLGSAAAIHARGLDVTERIRRDPDASPAWRERKRPDALQCCQVSDLRPGRIAVNEGTCYSGSADTGAARICADEPRDR
jgi:hypothetical protein